MCNQKFQIFAARLRAVSRFFQQQRTVEIGTGGMSLHRGTTQRLRNRFGLLIPLQLHQRLQQPVTGRIGPVGTGIGDCFQQVGGLAEIFLPE